MESNDTSLKKKSEKKRPSSSRTIQVKIGSQATKSMTPDQAAEYLKAIAGKGAFAAGREVKLTFNNTNGSDAAEEFANNLSSSGSRANVVTPTSVNVSHFSSASLTQQQQQQQQTHGAISELMGSDFYPSLLDPEMHSHQQQQQQHSTSMNHLTKSALPTAYSPGARKDGLPCSEKEMKALMSMFVEIMGLQMNTEKLPHPRHGCSESPLDLVIAVAMAQADSSPSSTTPAPLEAADLQKIVDASFSANLPRPPGGWPLELFVPPTNLRGKLALPTSTAAKSSVPDDDVPDLEDVTLSDLRTEARNSEHVLVSPLPVRTKQPPPQYTPAPLVGLSGIAIFDWDVLERVAIEDALEQEERARKGTRRRGLMLQEEQQQQEHSKQKSQEHFNHPFGVPSNHQPLFQDPSLSLPMPEQAMHLLNHHHHHHLHHHQNNINIKTSCGVHNAASNPSASSKKRDRERSAAQMKAVLTAAKKREKLIASWKSRVVAAIQSNEVTRLKTVLQESPLKKEDNKINNSNSIRSPNGKFLCDPMTAALYHQTTIKQHMDYLVPNCVTKNRASLSKGRQARQTLLEYIAGIAPQSLITPLRNGRSLFHTSCFYGDYDMTTTILTALASPEPPDDASGSEGVGEKTSAATNPAKGTTEKCPVIADIDILCLDSGLSPLMYACIAGSLRCMECLLGHGANVKTLSNDTHTWNLQHGNGLTVKQLVESVLAGTDEKEIETHGMALSELKKDLQGQQQLAEHNALLECVLERLNEIEEKGYQAWTDEEIRAREERALAVAAAAVKSDEDGTLSTNNVSHTDSGSGAAKNKKKKKDSFVQSLETSDTKKPHREESVNSSSSSISICSKIKDDPLYIALLGMGFLEEQVLAGIEACGGIDRATADDVIARIFGQDSETEARATARTEQSSLESKESVLASNEKVAVQREVKKGKIVSSIESMREEMLKKAEAERLAAERLAAKREEQRRRNREWNQKRQLQDAQAKLPKALVVDQHRQQRASTMVPGSNYLLPAATTIKNFPNAGAYLIKQQQPQQYSQLHHLDGSIPRTVGLYEQMNDTSTITSSLENVSVDVGNDDATISTLGSLPARPTPMLPTTYKMMTPAAAAATSSSHQSIQMDSNYQVAPPGFGSDLLPATSNTQMNSIGVSSQQAFFNNDILDVDQNITLSAMLPSRAPESQQLYASKDLSASTTKHALKIGQVSSPHLKTAADTISGFNGISTLDPMSLFTGPSSSVDTTTYESSYSGLTSGYNTNLLPSRRAISQGGRSFSDFTGLTSSGINRSIAFELEAQSNKALDSSVIDSISTGDGILPGSVFWESASQRVGSGLGSSLLGNLIQNQNSVHAPVALQGSRDELLFHSSLPTTNRSDWGLSTGVPNRGSFHRNGNGSIW